MTYKSKRREEAEKTQRVLTEAFATMYLKQVLGSMLTTPNAHRAPCPVCGSRNRGRREVREGSRQGRLAGYEVICRSCKHIFYSSVRY
jgi:hypothetical protein